MVCLYVNNNTEISLINKDKDLTTRRRDLSTVCQGYPETICISPGH